MEQRCLPHSASSRDRIKVVVAGHVCADITPGDPDLAVGPGSISEVGPLRMACGGSVANTGLALAALGHRVEMVANVGDDTLGRFMREQLGGSRNVLSALRALPGESTSYSIVLERPSFDRSFWHHIGANRSFDGTEINATEASVVHLGYPSLLPKLSANDGVRLCELLHRIRLEGATTSLDLAVDSSGTSRWPEVLKRAMPLVDVISPSADDLRAALSAPHATPEKLAEVLISWGAAVAMVTDGARTVALTVASSRRLARAGRGLRPLAALWAGASVVRPVTPVARIASTNGAGDVATAGLIDALATGLAPVAAVDHAINIASAHVQGEPLNIHSQIGDPLDPHQPVRESAAAPLL